MILGFVELIIGACARNVVTNYGFGAWWTGFCCFLAGMNGVLRGNRNLRGSGYCLSVVAVIMSIIGLLTDSVGFSLVNSLDTCMNQDNHFWGNNAEGSELGAANCAAQETGNDCICVNYDSSTETYTCYYFNLQHDTSNCLQVMGYYESVLAKSSNMCYTLVYMTIIWSIWICSATMCGPSCQQSCLPGCCDVGDQSDPLAAQDQQVVIITNNPNAYNPNQPQVVYVTQQPYGQQQYAGQQPYPQAQPQVVYAQATPVYGNNPPAYAQTGAAPPPPAYATAAPGQPDIYAKQIA